MTGSVAIGIPCLLRGGTEMQTLQLVRVLGEGEKQKAESRKQKGEPRTEDGRYGLTVVCYFESDPDVVAEFQAAGAKVRLLNLDRRLPAWKTIAALRRVFREERPDVVHVQYMAPGLLPIIAARLAGCCRVLATVHQPWTAENHGRKARFLLRTASRLCTKFICVSEAAERSWFDNSLQYAPVANRRPSNRLHFTIHNALDLERIGSILKRTNAPQLRQQLGLEGLPVIGIVSRLTREKGVDILLKAMSQVVKKVPQARLLIVGDGSERPALESQARTLGLSQADISAFYFPLSAFSASSSSPISASQPFSVSAFESVLRPPSSVLWLGRQPWEQCIELLSIMDVVVVPSRFEGFGLSAAEAMASGKPVVASDAGGLPEVLGTDGSTGVLFPAGNAERLAEVLFGLAESPARRLELGRCARRRVEERFSFTQYQHRTQALYSELLAD